MSKEIAVPVPERQKREMSQNLASVAKHLEGEQSETAERVTRNTSAVIYTGQIYHIYRKNAQYIP